MLEPAGEAPSFALGFELAEKEYGTLSKNELTIPQLCPIWSYQKKREAFKDLLKSLSSLTVSISDEDAAKVIEFFRRLYDDAEIGFRHAYSDVYEVLLEYFSTDGQRLDSGVPFEVVNLASNINYIEGFMEDRHVDPRTLRCFRKLQDHINLEHKRMNYINMQNRYQYASAEKLRDSLSSQENRFKSKIKKLTNDLNQKEQDIKGMQRDYIAILGVFAAIVLVFNSAIGFSSSTVEVAGAKYSFSSLLLVVLLVGFVLTNVVALLLAFIWKMTRKGEADMPDSASKILSWTNAVLVVCMIALLVRALFFPEIP